MFIILVVSIFQFGRSMWCILCKNFLIRSSFLFHLSHPKPVFHKDILFLFVLNHETHELKSGQKSLKKSYVWNQSSRWYVIQALRLRIPAASEKFEISEFTVKVRVLGNLWQHISSLVNQMHLSNCYFRSKKHSYLAQVWEESVISTMQFVPVL